MIEMRFDLRSFQTIYDGLNVTLCITTNYVDIYTLRYLANEIQWLFGLSNARDRFGKAIGPMKVGAPSPALAFLKTRTGGV